MASEPDHGLDDKVLLYSQLDAYPWDEDREFQGGLQAILGSVQDPEQLEHLTLRAKCYYFARKAGTRIDFDDYKAHVARDRGNGLDGFSKLDMASDLDPTSTTNDPNGFRAAANQSVSALEQPANIPQPSESGAESMGGGMANAPKPASFMEICDMIAQGKPIPGIKDIPDTVLEGQKSESVKNTRTKPWEKPSASKSELSWMSR